MFIDLGGCHVFALATVLLVSGRVISRTLGESIPVLAACTKAADALSGEFNAHIRRPLLPLLEERRRSPNSLSSPLGAITRWMCRCIAVQARLYRFSLPSKKPFIKVWVQTGPPLVASSCRTNPEVGVICSPL